MKMIKAALFAFLSYVSLGGAANCTFLEDELNGAGLTTQECVALFLALDAALQATPPESPNEPRPTPGSTALLCFFGPGGE